MWLVAGYRLHRSDILSRQELKRRKEDEKRYAAELVSLRTTDATDEIKATRAAEWDPHRKDVVKIQSVYRGYQSRKSLSGYVHVIWCKSWGTNSPQVLLRVFSNRTHVL